MPPSPSESSNLISAALSYVSVVNYSLFLCCALLVWVGYLLLPRGLRRAWCNAHPKRYARSLIRNKDGKNTLTLHRQYIESNLPNHSFHLPVRIHDDPRTEPSVTSSGYMTHNFEEKVSPTTHRHPSPSNGRYQEAILARRQLLENRTSNGATYPNMMFMTGKTDGSKEQHDVIHDRYEDLIDLDSPQSFRKDLPLRNQQHATAHSHIRRDTPRAIPMGKKIIDGRDDLYLPINRMRGGEDDFVIVDEEEEVTFDLSSPQPSRSPSLTSSANTSSSLPPLVQIVTTPSPNHPDQQHNAPSSIVISSSMTSLRQYPGVRLYAYGTQCLPRRVWLRFDTDKNALLWRTENATSATSTSQTTSSTMGRTHEIPIFDILYIDVGKTTAALRSLSEAEVTSSLCFSLLTKQGSLDLSAKTTLERDSLVSCFCLLLDECFIHQRKLGAIRVDGHWRTVYRNVMLNTVDSGSTVSVDVATPPNPTTTTTTTNQPEKPNLSVQEKENESDVDLDSTAASSVDIT